MKRTFFFSFFQPHRILHEISMRKAIRIISFAKRDAHSAPLFKVQNILNFQNLCKLNFGKLMWDLHYGNYPISLKNTLLFENKSRFDRQRFISQKCVPLSRTKYKAHFISSSGQICWRDIPENIKNVTLRKHSLFNFENIYVT